MTQHISHDQISEWVDGQLGAEDAGLVAAHLHNCPDCRAVEAEMSAVNRLFREAETLTPPAFLWTRIAAELQTLPTGTKATPAPESWVRLLLGRTGRPGWLQIRALVPAAALIVILIVGGSLTIIEYRSQARNRLAAIAEIDRAHTLLVASNLPTSNPFRTKAGNDLSINPFSPSSSGQSTNPFRPLRSGNEEGGAK